MNIAVFGLGYVGTVTAACLSGLGHNVIGVDTLESKVERFNRGESPVLEPGVDELLRSGLDSGRLRATVSGDEAVAASELAMICVGTPSRPNGDIDLSHVETVAGQIGAALQTTDKADYTLVIRSTVLPGTAATVGQILEQTSGRLLGAGISVAVNPEFLREGQGVADFTAPPLVLVGADNEATGHKVQSLYDGIDAPRRLVPIKVAELVKYANNSWHATKVTFANEVGVISQALGVDGREVMDILCADEKLNISTAYLRPGFAFGGSCLPKDVRALNFTAKDHDVATPLLSSLLSSNSIHVERLVDLLLRWDQPRIGFVGLAFKPGTDDLRESPIVDVVERMLGKGFHCHIHDPDISMANLVGNNLAYIEDEIPHLSKLLVDDVAELLAMCDVLVVSKTSDALLDALRSPAAEQRVIDLVGVGNTDLGGRDYAGVAW